MALLAVDKMQDLSERLAEFSEFGIIFKYMLDKEEIELKDLETIFFDPDSEKVNLKYLTLVKNIKPNYFNESFDLYSAYFPKEDSLNTSEYAKQLNKECINKIICEINENNKRIDKTYFNTYSFLLNESNSSKVARK